MGMIYPMQMLVAALSLLLAFPLATSSTITKTTSKEEIKCDACTPDITYPSPPPPVVECPPPPAPPSPPPPSPPPPRPTCPTCPPPCFGCSTPCNPCPSVCPGCPPPSCNACQIPNTPAPGPPQPGVIGGAVYSPPNEAVPYFPYSPPSNYKSVATSAHLDLKFVVSIIFLLLSATFSFF
ncbi:hypothetical protein PTKIN_Ptkin12aG0141000 [Pterospermum kingtungense]